MTVSMLALLIGLFVVPMVLLWLGHRLRRRTAASRGVFWGAVAGHTLGMLASVAAMHVPAVPWAGGDARTIVVHWGMLIGGMVGGAVGWIVMRARAGPGDAPAASPVHDGPAPGPVHDGPAPSRVHDGPAPSPVHDGPAPSPGD